jgi:CRP/FNR family cyclic AMP-dependent transcriptional regulator
MTALLGVTAFKGMDPAVLDRIEARSRMIEPRDGTQIFAQGDAADAVYAIVAGEGHVRIGKIDRTSKGLMIAISGAGDIFGEVAVIDGSTRTADAVAEGRVRLLRISGSVFIETLESNAALGANLCRIFASQMRRTSDLLHDAAFESLEVRLARQVLYLARREGRRTEQGLQLAGRFRQSDLADLLGATTRSIITILNAWRASGLVIYDPARAQLTLSGGPGLEALAGSVEQPERILRPSSRPPL